MADPTSPWIIGLTLTGTTIATGIPVRFYNRTTGEYMTASDSNGNLKINDNGKIAVDCNEFASGYTNGDVIEIRVNGIEYGSTTVTIDTLKGGDNTVAIATTTESDDLAAINA